MTVNMKKYHVIVIVFWIGLNPQPFTRVFQASVQRLLEQVNQTGTFALVP